MLTKLLKYDLKYMIKNMSVFYILSLFFSILTRILFNMEQSVMVKLIGQISLGCMISMIINIIINTMLRSWIRFRDSLYKDESYLTHTLPVTKNQLYNSKFIQTLIFYFIGFIIVLICLFITFYSKENWLIISNYVKSITTGLNMSNVFFISLVITLIFLEIFNAIQCGFFGIICGHRMNNGKIGHSVFIGFLAYIISQSLVLFLVYLYGLFDPTVMALFKTSMINIDVNAFKVLGVLASALYVFIILMMSFLCKKKLNKGVNIE